MKKFFPISKIESNLPMDFQNVCPSLNTMKLLLEQMSLLEEIEAKKRTKISRDILPPEERPS